MQTISTFVPRLAGAEPMRVTTFGHYPQSWVVAPEAAPKNTLSALRKSMQTLHSHLCGIHDANDVDTKAVKQAVADLKRAESVYFPPTAYTRDEDFWALPLNPPSDTAIQLPRWDKIVRVSKALAAERAALDAELKRLCAAKAYGNEELAALLVEKPDKRGLQPEADEQYLKRKLKELQAQGLDLGGGDGLTKRRAIRLNTSTQEAVEQEYTIFLNCFSTQPNFQSMVQSNGRYYDILVYRQPMADRHLFERLLWFDITAYWEHTYGTWQ